MHFTKVRYWAKLLGVTALIGIFPLKSLRSQSLTASPNPIYISMLLRMGKQRSTCPARAVTCWGYMLEVQQVHFAQGESSFSATTGPWVTNNMTFYLVDEANSAVLRL